MSDVLTEEELTEDIDAYLQVALAVGTKTGFSKGTADVSPKDLAKLRPLIKFYAKKPHPFTACVKDNRKRFGPLTEKFCAIIKDLIEGNTKWRNQGKKKSLSDSTLTELFGLGVDHTFYAFLSEVEDSVIEEIIQQAESEMEDEDSMTLSQETSYEDEPHLLAEMYLADESSPEEDIDGDIWKTILREGVWKLSPGPNAEAIAKPITVIKSGKSDPVNRVISMAELKRNFESGVIEHVTIPTSHKDEVTENTGFIKALRFGKDEDGRNILEAAMDFKKEDIKNQVLDGTIANTSAGILFDYPHKETGKKYRSVLAHAALTNRPWLNGMKPFGVTASEDFENLEIMGFSEDNEVIEEDPAQSGGGEEMPERNEDKTLFDLGTLGLSEDQLKASLAELEVLKTRDRERDVNDQCKAWQDEGKTPALVAEAKAIMMSDNGTTALNLSEDGRAVELTATDIVKRLVDAVPAVKLSEDPVNDKDASNENPDDDKPGEIELSQEEKAQVTDLYLNQGLSWEAAVEKVKPSTPANQS